MITRKHLLISLLVVLTSFPRIKAQLTVNSFLELGETNISEGIYLTNGYRSLYQYQRFLIEAGIVTNLSDVDSVGISGVDLALSADVKLKSKPIRVRIFYLMNFVSEYLHESNTGFTLEMREWKHLGLRVGNNIKTYTYNRLATNEFGISQKDRRFSEYINLLYDVSAYLKPIGNEWNLGIACTNTDQYVFNHATNPMLIIRSSYELSPHLSLEMNIGYKRAGIMNISAHHFGYFLRTGINWSL